MHSNNRLCLFNIKSTHAEEILCPFPYPICLISYLDSVPRLFPPLLCTTTWSQLILILILSFYQIQRRLFIRIDRGTLIVYAVSLPLGSVLSSANRSLNRTLLLSSILSFQSRLASHFSIEQRTAFSALEASHQENQTLTSPRGALIYIKMAMKKSDYLSEVWKDGIFSKAPPPPPKSHITSISHQYRQQSRILHRRQRHHLQCPSTRHGPPRRQRLHRGP